MTGHPEDSDECDECDGSGVYYIDNLPRACICIDVSSCRALQKVLTAVHARGLRRGVEKAQGRILAALPLLLGTLEKTP